jgi:hypothetical protein
MFSKKVKGERPPAIVSIVSNLRALLFGSRRGRSSLESTGRSCPVSSRVGQWSKNQTIYFVQTDEWLKGYGQRTVILDINLWLFFGHEYSTVHWN